MGTGKRLEIWLTAKDREPIEQLLGGGVQAVRTVIRALALLQMDQGQSTPAVGANLMLSAKAVWQIGKRYQQGGIEGRCSMPLDRAKLRPSTSNSNSGSSPLPARRPQKAGHAGRCDF